MNLNFFKKKEKSTNEQFYEPRAVNREYRNPSGTENKAYQNSVIPPQTSNNEITFRDEKTGEFIYQRILSENHKKLIMDTYQKNSIFANAFLSISLQLFQILDKGRLELENIKISEKEIQNTIQTVRDDLKIGKMWEFKPNLQLFERRDPPPG